MNRSALKRHLAAPFRRPTVDDLTRRFNHAYARTRDLDCAMAAVNEVLEHALTYRELLAVLREGRLGPGRAG